MPTLAYGAIDLQKNELRNAQLQNLASAPSSPVLGQLYFNTGDNTLYYCTNPVGPVWTAAKATAATVMASTVQSAAVGDAAVVGTSGNAAREDHKHGMPAFAAPTAETTFGGSSAAGSALTLARADHTHGNPAHDAAAHAAVPLSALAVPAAAVSFNSKALTNLLDPVNAQDGATKAYVDALAQGLDLKGSARAASTAAVAGITYTGTGGASGRGQITTAPNTLDGVTLAVGNRVLVKDEGPQARNGIYTVTTVGTGANGVWDRAADFDQDAEVSAGAFLSVEEGTANADTWWVLTSNNPITIGGSAGTAISWAPFPTAGALSAGAGLTKTGSVLDVVAGDTSLLVNADELHVNTAVIATVASVTAAVAGLARKYTAALTGTVSPETVTHNLGTRSITLDVLNGASPYTAVGVDWDATTVNTATVRFNPALGAGYQVVVFG